MVRMMNERMMMSMALMLMLLIISVLVFIIIVSVFLDLPGLHKVPSERNRAGANGTLTKS